MSEDTIRCEVLLFAQLAEAIGARSVTVDLPAGATVADALAHLAREHQAVAALEGRVAVAIDDRYQPRETTLTAGCTLALIPPVSGG